MPPALDCRFVVAIQQVATGLTALGRTRFPETPEHLSSLSNRLPRAALGVGYGPEFE